MSPWSRQMLVSVSDSPRRVEVASVSIQILEFYSPIIVDKTLVLLLTGNR